MKITVLILGLVWFVNTIALSQDVNNQIDKYIDNFEYEKAIKTIEEQENDNTLLLLKKAKCYKALNEYTESISILESLMNIDSVDIAFKLELAECYTADSQLKKAYSIYKDLLNTYPDNRFHRIQLAELLYKMKEYEFAINEYDSLMKINPRSDYLKRMGQCYEALKLPDNAAFYYQSAWEMNPKDVFSAASFININLKKECYDEAILYSEIYLKNDSTDKQVRLMNALGYYGLNDYTKVILRLTKLYDEGEDNLTVTRTLGLSCYFDENYHDARKFLKEAHLQDEKDSNVLLGLANSCLKTNRMEDALVYFKKLEEVITPKEEVLYSLYRGLGNTNRQLYNTQDAVKYFEKALGLSISADKQIAILQYLISIYGAPVNDSEKELKYNKMLYPAIEEFKNNAYGGDSIKELEDKYKLKEYMKFIESRIKELEASI